ncbi:Exosome component 10 [Nymphon striatum]|nr:Exosome component 10 [Nymphon striatum]KAG1672908.1 Exosome component 10 [Nymphon striatum]
MSTDINMDPDDPVTESSNSILNADKYSESVLRSMFAAIQSSRNLPSVGDEFDFYSSFRGFRTVMNAEGKNLLKLISKILKREGTKGNFENQDKEDQFDFLIDINDSILERISNACDEASGLKKKEDDLVLASISSDAKVITTSWNKKNASIMQNKDVKLLTARNVTRPQLKFADKIDNSKSLFASPIKEKPNSLKPLAIIIEATDNGEEYSHPYEIEIEKFNPGENLLCFQEPTFPKPIEETEFKFIDNVEDLRAAISELNQVNQMAVDLEAHSYRSFMGFTCLIQISTIHKDYIIDGLELRRYMFMLNECFTNPKIVKIFHGADCDIEWLQRDYGVYVVNLFDTYHASVLLNMARRSLAFLLAHHCNVQANKQYQLADWRIRPLPAEMIKYAREDTHYLLYIYEKMKKDLIESGNEDFNLLKSVFSRSKETCLRRFRKPNSDGKDHFRMYRKSHKHFNARQMYALENIHKWRDCISRAEDESPGYVLPNHMLLHISEILPREHQGILACCNPLPPLVKQHLNEIHLIILEARQQQLIKKVEVEQSYVDVIPALREIDTETLLHCPHDLSRSSSSTLPALFASASGESLLIHRKELCEQSTVLIKKNPEISVLKEKSNSYTSPQQLNMTFISPYERYKKAEKNNKILKVENIKDNQSRMDRLEHEIAKEVSQEVKKGQHDNETASPGHTKESDKDEVEILEEECLAIRRNHKRKNNNNKKKKKKPTVPFNESEPPAKRPKVQKSEHEIQTRPFKPFDYSQVNYNQG